MILALGCAKHPAIVESDIQTLDAAQRRSLGFGPPLIHVGVGAVNVEVVGAFIEALTDILVLPEDPLVFDGISASDKWIFIHFHRRHTKDANWVYVYDTETKRIRYRFAHGG